MKRKEIWLIRTKHSSLLSSRISGISWNKRVMRDQSLTVSRVQYIGMISIERFSRVWNLSKYTAEDRGGSDSKRIVRGNPRDGIQARGGTKHHWKCSCSNESWGWCRGSDDHICLLIKYINPILDIIVCFTRSSREIKVNSDLALLILRRICAMGFYQGFAGFVSPITRLDLSRVCPSSCLERY